MAIVGNQGRLGVLSNLLGSPGVGWEPYWPTFACTLAIVGALKTPSMSQSWAPVRSLLGGILGRPGGQLGRPGALLGSREARLWLSRAVLGWSRGPPGLPESKKREAKAGGSGGRDMKVWRMAGLARVDPNGRDGSGGRDIQAWRTIGLARVKPNGRVGSGGRDIEVWRMH